MWNLSTTPGATHSLDFADHAHQPLSDSDIGVLYRRRLLTSAGFGL